MAARASSMVASLLHKRASDGRQIRASVARCRCSVSAFVESFETNNSRGYWPPVIIVDADAASSSDRKSRVTSPVALQRSINQLRTEGLSGRSLDEWTASFV